MELIRGFTSLGRDDAPIAGGKGASLGEMTQAGISVPQGFVVLSSAFERFLEETDLLAEIDAVLHTVNKQEMHTVEHASEKIQQLVLNAKMPADIATEIQKHFDQLGASYVAVRSSATAEDSASAAWAGQLDSYLNTTAETLLKNVQRCWASLFTPRAIFYRFEKELHTQKISVAVVVQKMVDSELSGIAFSVHPITEDKNQLIIEAGYGLGEAIVSGQITPDSYVVEKEPRRIIDANANTQKRGLYRASNGGNEWRDIAEPKASARVLTNEQILELAELIVRIEKHYGFPCDIEWAFEGGKFYIVQSRPITTLKSAGGATRYTKVYTRENCLIAIQIWEKHQCELIKEKLDFVVPFTVFDAYEGVVRVYYHEKIFEIWGELIANKANSDPAFVPETMKWFGEHLDKLEAIWKRGKVGSAQELGELFDLAAWAWVGLSISYNLPSLNVSQDAQDLGMKLRERSIDFLELTDHAIQNTLHDLYPDLGDLVKYLTIEEVKANAVPTKAALQEREKHYIYFGFKLYTEKNVYELAQENGIFIEHEKVPTNASELVGQTAMGGKVQGKVRILRKKSEIPSLQKGEILVTAMTTPDYLPAMHNAAAFITDEGGITCHAAIVARELGKPCVIGTKIGTEFLKDGDWVEIDADAGIVRVLNQNPFGSIDQWQRLFRVQGLRFLIDDLWMEHYKTLDALTVIINDEYTSYLPHSVMERTIADGADLISNAAQFERYEAEFRAYMKEVQEFAASLDFATASKENIAHLLNEIARLFYYYSKTEFFSTDGAYKLFEETRDKGLEKRLERMGQIKNDGRSFLNSTFFGSEAVLPKLLKAFEQRFGIPERILQQYSRSELLGLFDEKRVADDEIERRNDAFYIVGKDGKTVIKTGAEAKRDIQAFVGEATREHSETITGTSAHIGKARGAARIIRAGYDNFDALHHLMDAMQKGDILVAETTSPELMPACQKAGGIITDQGGMLSHAAIVSRELNIPCVVGTSNATEAIKDGDIVEVDGDKGAVHIIERAQRG